MACLAACDRRERCAARRCLEKYGLGAARVLDGLFDAGPCRLVAEARAQIVQQRRNLRVAHAGGKARHDRAALALDGPDARQHDVGGIARIGAAEIAVREREIDAAIGQRPAALMAGRAGRGVDRCTGRSRVCAAGDASRS